MKKEIVKIERTEGGMEASVCVNVADLKELTALIQILQKLQGQLMQKIIEQAKEMGIPKDMEEKLVSALQGNEVPKGMPKEEKEMAERIRKKLVNLDKDSAKQLLKDIEGLVNDR